MLFLWSRKLYKEEGDYSDDKTYYVVYRFKFNWLLKFLTMRTYYDEYKKLLNSQEVMERDWNPKEFDKRVINNFKRL